MNKASKDPSSRLEGFICPACLVDFASASQVQEHWLNFHSTSSREPRNKREPEQNDLKGQHEASGQHQFRVAFFQHSEPCRICHESVRNECFSCDGCNYACHRKCVGMVKSKCAKPASIAASVHHTHQSSSSHKGIVKHLRHIVSKGRIRHVDKEFDLDLTYINERVIAMSFPATGLETTYRNNLLDVAKLLQTKHQDKYMVFNLSERRYDISKLNHQVLDFGWPDHLAPPLERLCSIIKSIDSWLKSDPKNVVVVHCKGGKGRTGVVISAYMHFSKMCSSPEAALDWFAMKRFYDDKLGGVTQPSQRRYVHHFSDYLEGKIQLSSDPIFLHHVIVHGIPNFDGKGGCKPFLRVYDGLKLIYTSGVFYVTQDMERICITIEGGLILNGDVLIKCYHKNTLSSGRDIIFRCQFHTGSIKHYSLVLDKTELDDAYRDKRFSDGCKVEFVFSATGNFVAGIKDDARLQSIIRHSLQPVENPDTVLMFPSTNCQDEEGWGVSEASSSSPQDDPLSHQPEPPNARHTSEGNTSESSDDFAGPLYVPGPLDGSLYAQVDKKLKKQIRSYSLDSGIPSRTSNGGDIFDKPNLKHSYDSRFGPRRAAQETATLNRYQFTRNSNNKVHSEGDIAMEPDFGGKIQSIEKLLKELGECSDLLDNTIQQGKKASDRTKPLTFQELSSAPLDYGKSDSSRPIYPPTPLRRTASYGATERYQERHAVPAKVARTLSRPNQSENYQRNPQNGNAWSPFPDPTSTSTPNKSSSLHRAPTLQPHASSLSPTFYASKVVMPHKTTIGQSYVPGDPANPSNPNGQGNPAGSSIEIHLAVNGYHDNDVDMAPQKLNGKGEMGGSHSDTNNNAPDFAPAQNGTFENEENGTENEGENLPRKGNVAAKVAYLTEIVFPALPPEARNPPRKGTVPMPGLVSKSPGDISDEISKYNATSLAIGELSHSSGLLYRGGAPQKISDIHSGPKDRANSELDAELAEKLKAVRERSVSAEITDQQEEERDLISRSNEAETESTGSPPVFVNNGPREFIIGEPISFTIPSKVENNGEAEDRESDGSSISELLEEATPAGDDDSYAHVEDVQEHKHVTRMEENRPSPIVISKDTCNEPPLVAVLSERPCTSPEEMEAIDGILSEMADINLEMPVEGAECPLIAARPATPQTPSSSVSGPFDNSPTKKKRSPYHSDKGYGSTNSLSSDSSVNDVFIDSPPPVPGVKFDKDTSQFWYKPSISRDQAINLLKDKEPGYFVVRDSQSFPGAYGLAVRVAVPPPHVLQGDLTKVDLASELIRHFLIESTKKGVKLKGISNEPVFGSLSAFVFQHTITPLSLPIRLAIPAQDLMPEITLDRQDGGTSSSPTSPTADTMKLMFVGECGVEMLSGTSAIQKTVESLLTYAASPKFTSTSFRITKQGITVTDNERKVFFRKHFQMSSVLYCGIDPLDQRWDLKIPSFSQKSRTFGLVVRKMGEIGNDCHLFAEMDESSPVNTVVNLVNRFMN